MTVSSANEAREIIEEGKISMRPMTEQLEFAHGYLAAMDGPEVRVLIKMIETAADGSSHCCEDCPCGYWQIEAQEALNKYRAAIGEGKPE